MKARNEKEGRQMKRIAAILLGFFLVAQSTVGWAESGSQEGTLSQIGYGTGSVVGSAVYFPFKASFCILGGITSGFALLTAGAKSANTIASKSCRGTWAISTDIVKGEEPVHFVGDVPSSGPETGPQAKR